MKHIASALMILFVMRSYSQEEKVLWADKVLKVSSEYLPHEYGAMQALNRPNVLPKGGQNPYAWRPKYTNREAFIVVSFQEAINAKQIAIAESENPGAVKAVYGYDSDFNEYLLFEITPRKLPIPSRLLNFFFDQTKYKLQAIKIILDCGIDDGYNSIDAIAISSSNIPINTLINLADGVNEKVQTVKLGKNVNSSYVEHSPILSLDGKRLFFSRQNHPDNVGGIEDKEDIWYSDLDTITGEWLPAKNLGAPLNTSGPNFISSISEIEGEEVIILGNEYGKNGKMYAGASISRKTANGYTAPQKLAIENFYNYSNTTDFFLTNGGNILLISAERDETHGKRDLYVSFKKKETNQWSEPKNMGKNLNTVGNEESPFMAYDNKTLYFSSDGQSNHGGGLDIFVSYRLDDTWLKWSVPESLGDGINHSDDDEYFSIPFSGKMLYFTRGREGKDMDIYTLKAQDLIIDKNSKLAKSISHLIEQPNTSDSSANYITFSGFTKNKNSGEIIASSIIEIARQVDGVKLERFPTNEKGEFSFSLKKGYKYYITAMLEGYISYDITIDLTSINKPLRQFDMELVPIKTGTTIPLNTIQFAFDSHELLTSSLKELRKILDYLKSGKISNIAVYGHTDNTGDSIYNQTLSEQRAKTVANFFVNNGIEKSRITFQGFGDSKPIGPNQTRIQRRVNRRVEFEIK